MIKKIIFTSCLITCFVQLAHAEIDKKHLPEAIKSSLFSACQTENKFVISATRSYALKQYPKFKSSIQNYVASDCKKEEIVKKKEIEKEAEKPLKSSIEAGFAIAKGNTKQENINIDFQADYEVEKWKTTFKTSAVNRKENEERTAEEYRGSLNSRYKLDPKRYFFGEAEYVSDRFSGYKYRMSETLGYGRVFISNDRTNFEAESSAGMRQSELSDGEKENSLLQKNTARFSYKLTENITFLEQASISFSKQARIATSETSLKTKLTKSLYLNFSLNFENISKVPAGTKNTDTLTKLNLGYSF
ncbi:MAG: putative salt-induced outer membrane protein [Lentimonas sp.]|jgi:putative salt-induced outer membrane protein